MIHLSAIAHESWFTARPWLVCGTGPSLERFEPQYRDLYNVWTINSAIEATNWADVAAMHDYDLVRELWMPPAERLELGQYITAANCKYIATRTSSVHLETQIAAQDHRRQLRYFEFDRDIHELQDGKRYFKLHDVYQSSNSSSFAFYFLGSVGIKTIYTIGIDGGKGKIALNVGDKYRERMQHHNFDKENEGMEHWCRTYDIKRIAI